MDLPRDFQEKMKNLLKEEYDDFIQSYGQNPARGLRINTLKTSIEAFLNISPFPLEKVPWTREGFYYDEKDRPGKHPYHEAGLYYIQEPSAMAVAECVDGKPGEKILDLCAAPGGKTTHIAAKMGQEGLLVANEIHPSRAKILSQNIERMGIKNAVVTNETPARLAAKFPNYFDRILVDAPCSGEGMFRKDPEARLEWSLENVKICVDRQMEILQDAKDMLRPGGRLVYSTCTFSPEENEGIISQFLKENLNFQLEDIQIASYFRGGRPDWVREGKEELKKTVRLWPHLIRGEGHFAAVLKKTDGEETKKRKYEPPLKNKNLLQHFHQFADEFLSAKPTGKFILFGDQLYILPEEMLSLDNLKVIRPGWHLGTLKKNRFEPSHALALSLKEYDAANRFNMDKNDPRVISYLKGESMQAEGKKGWHLVEVDGYSIGWGKLSGGILKNHYPKGLRWQ